MPENKTAPAKLYHRAVVMGQSESPSFRKDIFINPAKNGARIPKIIP